ncbi:MAG: glycosyltransferase family 2 protein [bacterium]
MTNTKITIITVNRNDPSGLEKTIISVASQNYKNIEYIVIDGASKDPSLDVIQKHSETISVWLSEPDSGIYNAMNKGIDLATGDYVLFINSGDQLLHDSVIDRAIRRIEESDFPDIVHGDVLVLSLNGEPSRIKRIESPDKFFLYFDSFHHQAMFYKRTVFLNHGNYNEDFRVYSDHEYTLRVLYRQGLSIVYIPEMVSLFWHGEGASSSRSNAVSNASERKKLQKQYFLWRDQVGLTFLYHGRLKLLKFKSGMSYVWKSLCRLR